MGVFKSSEVIYETFYLYSGEKVLDYFFTPKKSGYLNTP